MKEREFSKTILKASLGASVVLTVLGFVLKDNQEESCNDVSWRQEQSRIISDEVTQNIFQGGHIDVYQDPQSLIGVRFEWDPGTVVGKREVPRGNLTVCSRSSDTVITHRDGREWVVPVTRIDSIKIVNDFLVASYWAEDSKFYVPGGKREVIVLRGNDYVILEDLVSPYSVSTVTDEQIVYTINKSATSSEKRVRYHDGTERILQQENW